MMSRRTRAQALNMWEGAASSTVRPKLRWSLPVIISVSCALVYSAITVPPVRFKILRKMGTGTYLSPGEIFYQLSKGASIGKNGVNTGEFGGCGRKMHKKKRLPPGLAGDVSDGEISPWLFDRPPDTAWRRGPRRSRRSCRPSAGSARRACCCGRGRRPPAGPRPCPRR